MTASLAFHCNICGSANILRDAWAEWDIERQRWRLAEVAPAAYCRDCDGATKLAEREISGLPEPA